MNWSLDNSIILSALHESSNAYMRTLIDPVNFLFPLPVLSVSVSVPAD